MGEPAADHTDNPETKAADSVPRQKLIRRDLAQRLDAKLAEEVETAPRAPDAWLERRLRTFERQMGSVEQRQDTVEKNARASANAAEETIKAMQATIAGLVERVEAAEAKAKASAVELRTALNEATLRIQTVETVAHAALAESHPAPEPGVAAAVVDEPAPALPPSDEPPAPASEGEAHPDAALPEAPKSYLSEVRKNAAAAAAAAAAAEEPSKPSIAARLGLSRYFVVAIATVMLFAGGASVAFSKGVSDGRAEALGGRSPAVVAAHRVALLAATPLDKLTVRAQAGDPNAELAAGVRYLGGKDKNPAAAFHWITLAAVHGQPVAQYRLALLYTSGVGTAADPARALQWFEASALQGNRKAMHDLAIAYAQGQGAPKNTPEAVRWFSRAAGFGYVDSQFDLAVLYERGDGVPQSLLDAFKWYAVASRQGDAESKARLEALKTQLNSDDLAAAQHAADAFHVVPYSTTANAL
jgi:localization factor PodJL